MPSRGIEIVRTASSYMLGGFAVIFFGVGGVLQLTTGTLVEYPWLTFWSNMLMLAVLLSVSWALYPNETADREAEDRHQAKKRLQEVRYGRSH